MRWRGIPARTVLTAAPITPAALVAGAKILGPAFIMKTKFERYLGWSDGCWNGVFINVETVMHVQAMII